MIRRAISAILIIFICMLTLSCSGAVRLTTVDGGGIRDESTGKVYYHCTLSIAARTVGDLYGKGKKGFALYTVPDMDAGWLTEKSDIAFVYRQDNIPEPTLDTFNATRAVITQTQTVTIRVGSIDDTELVNKIIGMINTSPEVPYPSEVSHVYTVSFISEDYAGLLYNIMYVEGTDGRTYLRDRGTGICIDGEGILSDESVTTSDTSENAK